VQTSGFGLCMIYPNYLSCFKVVPEPPDQQNLFSKRLFMPQNTAYFSHNVISVPHWFTHNNIQGTVFYRFISLERLSIYNRPYSVADYRSVPLPPNRGLIFCTINQKLGT
jgi:hypothetical protein